MHGRALGRPAPLLRPGCAAAPRLPLQRRVRAAPGRTDAAGAPGGGEPSVVRRILWPHADGGTGLAAGAAAAAAAQQQQQQQPRGWPPARDHDVWQTDARRAARRTSYTFQDWRKHRSTLRYVYHLKTMKSSRIARGLLLPLFMICSSATAVCGYHTAHAAGWLAAWLPPLPLVPVEPFQLTSFALALLLVFRTNTSFQRWHEARCVFGRIADAARDSLRQALAVFPRDSPHGRAAAARWLVAFCYASKWALREDGAQRAELEGWLEPRELDAMMSSPDPPHYAMLVLSHTLRANLGGQPVQLAKMMDGVGSMMYNLSSCSRILSTPIPLSYTRHTTRFMVLWLLLLPLALWAKCGWGTVPAAGLVSLALLTIEAIGVSLEEPFSILALETICDNLARSVATMASMDQDAFAMAAAIGNDGHAAAGGGNGHAAGGSSSAVDLGLRRREEAEQAEEFEGALPAAATARPGGGGAAWR